MIKHRVKERKSIINYVLIAIIAIELIRVIRIYYNNREINNFVIKRTKSNCEISFFINKSRLYEETITVKSKSIALLLYFPDSFPCPYDTDREELIIPEINKLAQYMRSIGSKVIFKTSMKKNVIVNNHIELKNIDEWNSSTLLNNYSKKSCLFSGFEKKTLEFNETVHHGILSSSNWDAYVNKFEDAVRYAYNINASYVLLCGMSSNEWMPIMAQQLNEKGIKPLIISDLTDVSYSHKTQVSIFPTHNSAIDYFIDFMYSKGVMTVNHYEILCNFLSAQCIPIKHVFDTNNNNTYYYKYFFE